MVRSMINKLFIALLAFCSLSVQATDTQSPDPIKDAKLVYFASLPSLNSVKLRVVESLLKGIGVSHPEDIVVDRVYGSNLYSVRVGASEYVTDSEGSYWIKSPASEVFLFGEDVVQVNINNQDRESLMELTAMLPYFEDTLVVYPPLGKDKHEVIFVFMDLSCPFCKRFHLSQRLNLQKAGFAVAYIPFLRNINDVKIRELTLFSYCLPAKERLSFIDEVYMSVKPESAYGHGKKMYPNATCNPLQESTYDSLMSLGHRFNLNGSPVFFNEKGKLFYGYGSLEKSVLK